MPGCSPPQTPLTIPGMRQGLKMHLYGATKPPFSFSTENSGECATWIAGERRHTRPLVAVAVPLFVGLVTRDLGSQLCR
ncbi:hypothetical protein LY78DRAFT_662550 [Colletotrichum sublineola]|nr:hypothetical protein LY78DRAFT_662550 [Colletotrichum sublineola]